MLFASLVSVKIRNFLFLPTLGVGDGKNGGSGGGGLFKLVTVEIQERKP